MFGIDFGQLKIVRYTYPPKSEGRLWTAFGVLCLLVTVILGVIDGFSDIKGLAILAAISVAALGYGLYCWKLRRKPFSREITLGTPMHRLWLRSRWLYVVVGLAVNLGAFVVVLVAALLLFGDGNTAVGIMVDTVNEYDFVFYLAVGEVLRGYTGYRRYYRSPHTESRDLYTEALKQMNDAKKGKQY